MEATRDDTEAELYRTLAPRVRLYGRRHLRDEQAAEDLAQEVMLLTIERLRAGQIREPDKLPSFVLGVCRMKVRDRRRGGARQAPLLEEYTRTLDTHDAPRELEGRRLEHCLEELTERERSLLVMTFYVDRTTEEIMKDLRLSASNVRVVRHRALGRLRDCMEEKRS